MSTPRIVVFDIGNILLRWDPELLYRRLIPDVTERRAFFEETRIDDMNLEVDRGAPFAETVEALARQHPHHAANIRAWRDGWDEMVPGLIEENCNILRALREKGVPVWALSNFGVETFAHAEKRFPILAEFDRRYISGHMRMVKPEPGIYRAVTEDSGAAPGELLFIDDRADNVAAAAAQGWHIYHYRGESGFASLLKSFALL